MDVDFCLSLRRDTVKQCHLVVHHLKKNLIIGISLCVIERFHVLWMGTSTIVQTTDFLSVGCQYLLVDQAADNRHRATGNIHQFLVSDRLQVYGLVVALGGVMIQQ